MNDYIDVIFDGPPSHDSGRFVEVNGSDGRSIDAGGWIKCGNGLWCLRIALNGTVTPPLVRDKRVPLVDEGHHVHLV